ncbi:mevalonate kinase [Legionella lytica]|uniref:Mevalonate kinase n=1 Tax=Legionella lytica TaxID=96232 RepID=A0ABW8D374_9GAMM
MKWLIPAKTFLLGEYAAVAEASAIVLTTSPYFELSHNSELDLVGIHPQSPAGLWWQQQNHLKTGLSWHDPYAGCGGLGASSAQFLASYLASCMLQEKPAHMNSMLEAYYQVSWTGKGLRPSGYDVIAQSQHGCVYINRQNNIVQCYAWPFQNLSFFLIHTGVKLATHHHLQDTALPAQIDYLSNLVDTAKNAFEQHDSQQLVTCINDYHAKLAELGLVAEHSQQLINQFKSYPEVLAIKGCGALGADIILVLTSRSAATTFNAKLQQENRALLATEKFLNFTPSLLAIK